MAESKGLKLVVFSEGSNLTLAHQIKNSVGILPIAIGLDKPDWQP
jgi:hypothetical protein